MGLGMGALQPAGTCIVSSKSECLTSESTPNSEAHTVCALLRVMQWPHTSQGICAYKQNVAWFPFIFCRGMRGESLGTRLSEVQSIMCKYSTTLMCCHLMYLIAFSACCHTEAGDLYIGCRMQENWHLYINLKRFLGSPPPPPPPGVVSTSMAPILLCSVACHNLLVYM